MIKPLTSTQKSWVEETLHNMSEDQKIAHVLCPFFNPYTASVEDVIQLIETVHPGCIFFLPGPAKKIKEFTEAVRKHSKIPTLVAMDILWGAGHVIKEECTTFVSTMACGAADQPDLTHAMGEAIAKEARAMGVHWTLGPIVDINVNPASPIVNFRSYGDCPEHVARHANAFISGVQDAGLMAATAKHFPGDGVDDRDQHFLTSINSLDRATWDATFGKTFRSVIDNGVCSIMSGHIGLPAVDPGEPDSYLGAPPASLSKKQLRGVVRDEFGFEGLIVSDAIRMTGLTSHAKFEDIGWRLLDAGNDVILFSEPDYDIPSIKNALKDGKLDPSHLDEAVQRVLEMKCRVGIAPEAITYELSAEEKASHEETARKLGHSSIRIVRNLDNVLPLKLSSGDRVLTITIQYPRNDAKFIFIDSIDDELRAEGLEVDHMLNPSPDDIIKVADQYAAVFININVGSHGRAGIIRLNNILCEPIEAVVQTHPRTIVTSFGDPYKLYEMPYIRTYMNTFSPTQTSVEAAVKVWLGKEEALGKNPIELPGFFSREVE
ncbi:glycoside hydrolase family 3 protein [Tichowtungia aerotolerans]|uniref:beta-N-acetylhexosaminidase n=1 Tax=Tichowtungia aerotolerans TaxID=2697043 RepID=A0A6P1LZR2_9BACT|nr:glycoside hydrolase family 3 N-terminal domain-containing protein [Tichowtungia aerotolerans]QHI68029.1 hypothetical protein GT409_00705 [Tichowtungia aerotolerans]